MKKEAYQYIQCRVTEDKMREKEPGKIWGKNSLDLSQLLNKHHFTHPGSSMNSNIKWKRSGTTKTILRRNKVWGLFLPYFRFTKL